MAGIARPKGVRHRALPASPDWHDAPRPAGRTASRQEAASRADLVCSKVSSRWCVLELTVHGLDDFNSSAGVNSAPVSSRSGSSASTPARPRSPMALLAAVALGAAWPAVRSAGLGEAVRCVIGAAPRLLPAPRRRCRPRHRQPRRPPRHPHQRRPRRHPRSIAGTSGPAPRPEALSAASVPHQVGRHGHSRAVLMARPRRAGAGRRSPVLARALILRVGHERRGRLCLVVNPLVVWATENADFGLPSGALQVVGLARFRSLPGLASYPSFTTHAGKESRSNLSAGEQGQRGE